MITPARMYHIICLVLHAGQRILAQLVRLPQLGHLILVISSLCSWKNLLGMFSNGRYFSTRRHSDVFEVESGTARLESALVRPLEIVDQP